MAGFWLSVKIALRTGAWLTAERIRTYCLLLLVISMGGLAAWIVVSDGIIDPNGKPIGTDFASFYAAGRMALSGHAADAYDMAAHYAREQQIFGVSVPYYAWLYPPIFFLIAAPLALMPYPLALAVWQGATLALYLGVVRSIVRSVDDARANKHWLLVALAFPAVFVNLGHGQNGFLSAALLGVALLALPRRPFVAGILFGLLSYKPQFALVIPGALIAAGQWRAIFAACVTVAALIGVTTFLFGNETWFAFAASSDISRKLLLEQGDVGFEKLQSVFAAIRLWGGSVPFAYAIQGLVSAVVICTTAIVWRSKIDHAQKAAILVIATLFASPHVLDYDLTILGVAIAYSAAIGMKRGFGPYGITILAAIWVLPLLARSVAGTTGIPLGVIAISAFYIAAVRRALPDVENLNHESPKLAQV